MLSKRRTILSLGLSWGVTEMLFGESPWWFEMHTWTTFTVLFFSVLLPNTLSHYHRSNNPQNVTAFRKIRRTASMKQKVTILSSFVTCNDLDFCTRRILVVCWNFMASCEIFSWLQLAVLRWIVKYTTRVPKCHACMRLSRSLEVCWDAKLARIRVALMRGFERQSCPMNYFIHVLKADNCLESR
jgi:hypothetical protein